MIQTVNFKTKTNIIARKNPCKSDKYFPLGIDYGYSGVKLFSPNKVACFPNFAIKAAEGTVQLTESSRTDIQYRDETGLWYVGELAQQMTEKDDTNYTNAIIRKRFNLPMFKVIANVGLGLGMSANEFGSSDGKTLVLQTGLPPAYIKSDAKELRAALAGKHKFELKIGTSKWIKFEFELPAENIYIMEQPLGSLVSFTVDAKGHRIPDYQKYMSSRILISDGGYGTDDYFDIKNGRVINDRDYTRSDLGMKRVFEETSKEFYRRHSEEMPVHTLQNFLAKGEYPIFKIDENGKPSQEMVSFANILEEKNKEVCMMSINYMTDTFNYLKEHQYLLVTGGTGAARLQHIKDHFAGMSTLKVISANANDNLPHIYSNVRGYYFRLLQVLESKG